MWRGHVQISDVGALDADRALQAILNGSRLSSVASLQLLVRLLHGVRPDWLSSFPAFRRWLAHTTTLLSRILHWSTTAFRLSQVPKHTDLHTHNACQALCVCRRHARAPPSTVS